MSTQPLAVCGLLVALAACGHTAATTPASAVFVQPAVGERHLRNIRQLTFGGNNAESYFSRSGRQLIFQRQEQVDAGCDQEYLMNIDGSNVRRVSNGKGRTTCGFFYANDQRLQIDSGAVVRCRARRFDCPSQTSVEAVKSPRT